MTTLSTFERALLTETQAGLPLVSRPFLALGQALGASEADVLACFEQLGARGVLRRIAAVPNHYALGYVANAMTVWAIDDSAVDNAGIEVAALTSVSHCYRRPRVMPNWPFNLFAMVHGRNRDEVSAKVEEIATLLAGRSRRHDILFSTRILKKTGLRLKAAKAT